MKKKAIEYLIKLANKKGAKEVRSNLRNHETPNALMYRGTRKTFTPDLVAFYPEKRDFFSIESKITKKSFSEVMSKWILFGLEARKQGGQFYIVVPEKEEQEFQHIIDSKQISAQIISI